MFITRCKIQRMVTSMVEETLKIRDKGKKLKDLITKTINDALNLNFNNNSYDVFVLDKEKIGKMLLAKILI